MPPYKIRSKQKLTKHRPVQTLALEFSLFYSMYANVMCYAFSRSDDFESLLFHLLFSSFFCLKMRSFYIEQSIIDAVNNTRNTIFVTYSADNDVFTFVWTMYFAWKMEMFKTKEPRSFIHVNLKILRLPAAIGVNNWATAHVIDIVQMVWKTPAQRKQTQYTHTFYCGKDVFFNWMCIMTCVCRLMLVFFACFFDVVLCGISGNF